MFANMSIPSRELYGSVAAMSKSPGVLPSTN